jgi:hypothetical protein
MEMTINKRKFYEKDITLVIFIFFSISVLVGIERYSYYEFLKYLP